ncbi:MAG: carbohydrate kinase family protein [Clostridiales bacterium]|nr:carbohydrate kinase family protein [Clostridiales bacterium]
MNKRFAVVGGSCVDIFAASSLPLVAYDSNPGTVSVGFGGVGRNIAENLARLKQKVHLIAAFGSDPFSVKMLADTAASGVNTEDCLLMPDLKAPYYIAVNEPSGDMAVAVNDMESCNQITPAFLSGKLAIINQCDAVILDTNIPRETIDFLTAECKPPLFADAVSTKKALKLTGALPRLFGVNLNLREAQALLNAEVSVETGSLTNAADIFHDKGICYVLITLGENGAFLSAKHQIHTMKAFSAETRNLNGCGDAFCAAAFLGIVLEHSPEDILKNALSAAAITAQSVQSVSKDLSPDRLRVFSEKMRNP